MLNNPSITLNTRLTASQKSARSLVFSLLSKIKYGSLTVIESFNHCTESRTEQFGALSTDIDDSNNLNSAISAHAVMEVKQPDFYLRVLKGGSIAAAEAYMDGWWDSPDLTVLTQLMACNQAALDNIESQSNGVTRLLYKVAHWLNRNTPDNSKKNIHAHYDLGNSLYELFLDENMLYSSALFEEQQSSLEQAQISKMDRLCRQLNLQPGDRVMEIGTGWGAMAIYMAKQYGCHVTTTTISNEQYEYAKHRIAAEGLQDNITLLKQDYRLLSGSYDKLVSIEMVEAVGKAYLPSYIEVCHRLLKPGGLMAIQSITIADQRYRSYSNQVDFIQKYIFPGGFLPSITALLETTTKHSSLIAVNIFDMGNDYARTLNKWHERFNTNINDVKAMGYDNRFIRMWRYYLSYCEGGFLSGSISAVQLTLRKPFE